MTALTVLDLECNNLKLAGAVCLGPRIAKLKRLQTLNIGYYGLGARGAWKLCLCLTRLPALHVLGLQYNRIGDQGVKLIVPYLAKMLTLQSIYLRCNDVDWSGFRALLLEIPFLYKLIHRDVHF
jgi:Ran GTPase-activating protein (RanGAP) involved in mRNA processing and transport